MHPNTDSASDNETSERPVREKLKKTSIASMPQDSLLCPPTGDGAFEDNKFGRPNSSIKLELTSLAKNPDASANRSSGKPERHQLFKDSSVGGQHESCVSVNEAGRTYTPTQKNYISDHFISPKEKSPRQATKQAASPEYEKSEPGYDKTTISSRAIRPRDESDILALPQTDSDEHEMGYTLFGPRKKRSRDQLDAEIDREQKIVATEEAKAQRRSEEQERDSLKTTTGIDAETQSRTVSASSQREKSGPRIFSNSSTLEVYIGLEFSESWHLLTQLQVHLSSDAPAARVSQVLTTPQSNILASPFDPSESSDLLLTRFSLPTNSSPGLEALPATSYSTLSTEDFHPKISRIEPLDASVNDARNGNQLEKTLTAARNVGSHVPTPSSPLRFGSSKGSTANILGPSGFSSIGSGVFGAGFAQALNGGAKLSSFAAPVGDTNWGDQGGSTNLFGAAAKDEEEDDSENDEYGLIDAENNEENYEVICRFQQQDGRFLL